MLPVVRSLYKQILNVGKDYPKGLQFVRSKAKIEFMKNADLTSEREIKRKVHDGRWHLKEMIGVIKLKKYRQMKHRYYDS